MKTIFDNKSLLLIALVVFFSLPLTGCWGQGELNEMGMVMVTGIDRTEGGQYKLTVMSALPTSTQGQQGSASNMWIGVARGSSVPDAMRNLNKISPKELTWIHNNYVIIGEAAAREGVGDIMEYFIRDWQNRMDKFVLVAEGEASSIMATPADTDKSLFRELEGITRNSEKWAKVYISDFMEFMIHYANKTCDVTAAKIGTYKADRTTLSSSRSEGNVTTGESKILYIYGTAVFKDGKLVGWLDGEETRGLQWFINKINEANVEHSEPEKGIRAVMEVIVAKCNITPFVREGKLVFRADVNTRGRLIELIGGINIMDIKETERLEKSLAKVIENEMRRVFEKVQKEYKADIFLFGDKLYRTKPSIWREVEEDWDEVFTEVEVEYNVKVVLRGTGELINNIKRDREE